MQRSTMCWDATCGAFRHNTRGASVLNLGYPWGRPAAVSSMTWGAFKHNPRYFET